jgi:hypothetical protein
MAGNIDPSRLAPIHNAASMKTIGDSIYFFGVLALVFGGIVAALAIRRGSATLALVVCCVCASLPLGVGFLVAYWLGTRELGPMLLVLGVFLGYAAHPLLLQRLRVHPIVYLVSSVASVYLTWWLIRALRELPP